MALPDPIVAGTGPARYVDGATGSDSNDGTSTGTAWKTIGKAFDDAVASPTAGRTYYIRAGTYTEAFTKTIASTAGNSPTFTNYPGEQVIWKWLKTTTTSGITLPNATVPVADLTNFTNSGTLSIWNDAATPLVQSVTYTGKSAATGPGNFTGCAGGTGGVPSGQFVQPGTTLQLSLSNCAYVRIVGTDVAGAKGIKFDGQYCRRVGDNNSVIFFTGTTHHCLLQGVEITGGHDHGCLSDVNTHDLQIIGNYFHDGGSPPAYPMASATGTGGSPGLSPATYFYTTHVKYETGTIGTRDTGGTDQETSKTTDGTNNRVVVSWPNMPRNQGYRVWRGTSSGNYTAYIDVAQNVTSLNDQGQAFTSGTFTSANISNRDHAQYLEGADHLFMNNLVAYWDFGHVVQVFPTADRSILTHNTIVHSPYSAGATALWHNAAIVVGSDVGGQDASDCTIVNNLIAYTSQGIYGFESLNSNLKTLQGGGITLPNDTTTTFTVTLNNTTNLEADGQIVIGAANRTVMSLIRYSSISGNQLLNCTCIGHGLGLTWSAGEQVRGNPPGFIGGSNNVAHHNLFYSIDFTSERNDPSSDGNIPIINFLTGNIKGSDPKFTNDSARDWTLLNGSPAYNAGDPNFTPSYDFNGNNRVNPTIGAFRAPEETAVGGDSGRSIQKGDTFYYRGS